VCTAVARRAAALTSPAELSIQMEHINSYLTRSEPKLNLLRARGSHNPVRAGLWPRSPSPASACAPSQGLEQVHTTRFAKLQLP
jgi:hypothetical protein